MTCKMRTPCRSAARSAQVVQDRGRDDAFVGGERSVHRCRRSVASRLPPPGVQQDGGLTGDAKCFVDVHRPYVNSRLPVADLQLRAGCSLVRGRVQLQAGPLQTLTDAPPYLRAVLADAAAEDQRVGAAQHGRGRHRRTLSHGSRRPQPPGRSRGRLARAPPAGPACRSSVRRARAAPSGVLSSASTSSGGHAGQRLQPYSGKARVEVAGAGAHDQALQRREAHRRVHGLAVEARGGGAAVAELQRDQARSRDLRPQRSKALHHVACARPWKPKRRMPYRSLRSCGHGVARRHLRQVGEEGGVEGRRPSARCRRRPRATPGWRRAPGRLCSGRQLADLLGWPRSRRRRSASGAKAQAAVHDAMAHGLDAREAARILQGSARGGEGLAVVACVGERARSCRSPASSRERGVLADAVDRAGCEPDGLVALTLDVEDVELEAGAAAVERRGPSNASCSLSTARSSSATSGMSSP